MNRTRFRPGAAAVPLLLAAAVLPVLLLCSPATQRGPGPDPRSVGLSPQRLQRIDTAVGRAVKEKGIAGAVCLVARRGRIAYLRAFGMADREAGRPMTTDAIFRICSMTKPITSVAVLMLYEEGRFMLDDPVSRYIPAFADMKVLDPPYPADPASPPANLQPARRPVTIRQLLTHSAGLTYHWNPRLGKAYREAGVGHGMLQQPGTIAESTDRLARLPLLFQPGEGWEYSLADDVLGRLVEVVSGLSFDRFLSQRIFKPLGMKDTAFFLEGPAVARLAAAYTWDPQRGLLRFPDQPLSEGDLVYSADYPVRGPRTFFSGGAGLCSTATDYYRFCQMLLNGGSLDGRRLLSRKTVELATSSQVPALLKESAYGLGVGVEGPAPLKELGSPGAFYWGGFFYTSFVVDPREQLVVIFMAQQHPGGDSGLDRLARVLAYQAIDD